MSNLIALQPEFVPVPITAPNHGAAFVRRMDMMQHMYMVSLDELAAIAKCTVPRLSQVRAGSRAIGIIPLLNLAGHFNTSVAWWIGESQEQKPHTRVLGFQVTPNLCAILRKYSRARRWSLPHMFNQINMARYQDSRWMKCHKEDQFFVPKLATLEKLGVLGLAVSQLIGETPWQP